MEQPVKPRVERQAAGGHSRRWVLVVCLLLSGLLLGASRSSFFVEQIYAAHLGPAISRGLGVFTHLFPFSLAEGVLAGVGLWLAGRACLGLRAVLRRECSWGGSLLQGGARLATLLCVAATLFYGLWGVQYARQPLEQRLHWQAAKAPSPDALGVGALRQLCAHLVVQVNRLYQESHPGGKPPQAQGAFKASFDRDIDQGLARVGRVLGLHGAFGKPRGRAKPILASSLMSSLGLLGFYFPWTGEANFNNQVPLHQRVVAVAHEKAHQRGITSEDEANFVGSLACMASDDVFLRYAGYLFAQRQLLRELARWDVDGARELVRRRLPGVQEDVNRARAFWHARRGWAMRTSARVNDRFLRLNGVAGGLASYQRSARLLLLFARKQGGTLDWPR